MDKFMEQKTVKPSLAESLQVDRVFIILHETLWESILKDFVTFGFIGAITLMNHTVGWDSLAVDAFAVLGILAYVHRAMSHRIFRVTTTELVDIVRRMDKEKLKGA